MSVTIVDYAALGIRLGRLTADLKSEKRSTRDISRINALELQISEVLREQSEANRKRWRDLTEQSKDQQQAWELRCDENLRLADASAREEAQRVAWEEHVSNQAALCGF